MTSSQPANQSMRLSLVFLALWLCGCLAAGDRPPQLVQWSEPVYPASAQADRVEGFVTLAYQVSATGQVSGITVVESQPSGVFDAAAIAAVSRWRYAAAIVDGSAIAVDRMTSTVHFTLGDGERYKGL